MNILSVENLSKSFGTHLVFSDLTFGIDKGEKVGLIARNGTGKTTLLDCLVQEQSADDGIITFRKGVSMGYLSQNQDFDPKRTVLETVFQGDSDEMKAIRHYEEKLEEGQEDDAFFAALNEMERVNAWSFESKAKEILFKLGLNTMSKEVGHLSGGQQKRLGLALELIKEPDFLILDEPTNHLDINMIEWLEEHLEGANITLLLVTHDRFFLDHVCTVILELESGQMHRYKGNYSYYLEKKAERVENLNTVISKAKSAMRKEIDWIRRQPKARGTKAKYRIQAFDDLKKTASTKVDKDEMNIEVSIPRMGSKVVELHKISKSYDDHLLIKDLTYHFLRHERVGIIGPNGSGKSTLLEMILGNVKPDKGKVVQGETIVFGYFSQAGLKFKEGQRLIESIREIADVIPLTKSKKISAAQLLERFMFPRDMHFTPVSKLSGGELRRLHLLRVLMGNPNFLILDEPTNDLDIFTLQILEEYLLDFPGVVLVVSHDRHFMDKVINHCFVLGDGGKVRDFPGNYSQYMTQLQIEQEAEAAVVAASKAGRAAQVSETKPTLKTKLTYAERIELEELEKAIPKLEEELLSINEEIASSNDAERLAELTLLITEQQALLEAKTDRWMLLSELVD